MSNLNMWGCFKNFTAKWLPTLYVSDKVQKDTAAGNADGWHCRMRPSFHAEHRCLAGEHVDNMVTQLPAVYEWVEKLKNGCTSMNLRQDPPVTARQLVMYEWLSQ